MELVLGRGGVIPGGDHANLCLAWGKPGNAWHNIPYLYTALVILNKFFNGKNDFWDVKKIPFGGTLRNMKHSPPKKKTEGTVQRN